MATTIRELAKQLDLSITTVSRALDGYDDVSENTRKRVIQAAHQMGYTPNRAARQLRTQRADTIGYILPASSSPRFSDPFFSEFIAGLGDAAAEKKLDLLVSTAAPGQAAERELYERWMNGHKVDGFILNRMRVHDWRVQTLAERKFPFVTLEKTSDPYEYACVTVDNRKGFRELVDHLIRQGRRRIAYIGGFPELAIQAHRFAGYQDALAGAGIQHDPNLVAQGDLSRHGGYLAAQQLFALSKPPDGIVCINDLTAIGVLEAAQERGLEVGKEIAVAGFDGIEEAAHTRPPLTTLSQPVYWIAQQLVHMLGKLIDGQSLENPCLSLNPELILRESTAHD